MFLASGLMPSAVLLHSSSVNEKTPIAILRIIVRVLCIALVFSETMFLQSPSKGNRDVSIENVMIPKLLF